MSDMVAHVLPWCALTPERKTALLQLVYDADELPEELDEFSGLDEEPDEAGVRHSYRQTVLENAIDALERCCPKLAEPECADIAAYLLDDLPYALLITGGVTSGEMFPTDSSQPLWLIGLHQPLWDQLAKWATEDKPKLREMRNPQPRKIWVVRCWQDGTWDTLPIEVPSWQVRGSTEEQIRQAAVQIATKQLTPEEAARSVYLFHHPQQGS